MQTYPSSEQIAEWRNEWLCLYATNETELEAEQYIARKACDWQREATAIQIAANVSDDLRKLERLKMPAPLGYVVGGKGARYYPSRAEQEFAQ